MVTDSNCASGCTSQITVWNSPGCEMFHLLFNLSSCVSEPELMDK